jgi:hypothetical protein
MAIAHALSCSIAVSLALTSVATSGSGVVVLVRPARYNSPPMRANHSGEKPSVSVAKTAWQVSLSGLFGLKCGLRTRSECPPRAEIGMRVVELGKRVLKTRGDQAPLVITRRVHGTVRYELEKSRSESKWSYILSPRHLGLSESRLTHPAPAIPTTPSQDDASEHPSLYTSLTSTDRISADQSAPSSHPDL